MTNIINNTPWDFDNWATLLQELKDSVTKASVFLQVVNLEVQAQKKVNASASPRPLKPCRKFMCGFTLQR